MSPHRYARFYGKLTNLYIKMRETQTNCMEITQQELPQREGDRDRRIHKVIAEAILQKCSRNCWQFVVLSQTLPPTFSSAVAVNMSCNTFRGSAIAPRIPILSCFSCAICQLTHFPALVHELIVKSYWEDVLPPPSSMYLSSPTLRSSAFKCSSTFITTNTNCLFHSILGPIRKVFCKRRSSRICYN